MDASKLADRVRALPWPSALALLRFFTGLFPVCTMALYTVVASSWLRGQACTAQEPYGFLSFWLVMLLLAGAVQFTNLWFYQYDAHSISLSRTHFVLRQTLGSVLHQFVWSSLGVSLFHCFPNYKAVFMGLVPVMAVLLLLGELVRYTLMPLDLAVHWQQLQLTLQLSEHHALATHDADFVPSTEAIN